MRFWEQVKQKKVLLLPRFMPYMSFVAAYTFENN